MINILKDHPVSRMPSLYLTYALFKEHESTILDGNKIISTPEKGAFILNPDKDLKHMEVRMNSFIKYWKPDWKGLIGVSPTTEQFKELLTSSDIFS